MAQVGLGREPGCSFTSHRDLHCTDWRNIGGGEGQQLGGSLEPGNRDRVNSHDIHLSMASLKATVENPRSSVEELSPKESVEGATLC